MTAYDEIPPPTAPAALEAIARDTEALGFTMSSTRPTGVMLRALAASKPNGRMMELGTGTGMATAWLLDGMSRGATLDTVDSDLATVAIARRHLGDDSRVRFHMGDGAAFLQAQAEAGSRFDLIFADTWPGKFTDLDVALSCLAAGGLYVIDDLLPQPSWPAEHFPKVPRLLRELAGRRELFIWPIEWDTGILVATKKSDASEMK
jgi:predicted O-methyltransferase YrrM